MGVYILYTTKIRYFTYIHITYHIQYVYLHKHIIFAQFFVQVNFFKIKIKNINFFLREQENDNDEDFFTVKVDSNA